MKVEKTVIDNLNAELKLVIEKEDYLDDYKNKIKSYRQKSHMKGFRKGKTPLAMIQKMYGSSTMQESVSKVLTDKINEIIAGDEFNIIGEPLLLNEDKLPHIDYKDPGEYIYEFQLGLEPEFEVDGIDESDTYTKYLVDADDALINEEIQSIRMNLGTNESTNDAIIEEDDVSFELLELEGDKIKPGGHSSEMKIQVSQISEDYSKDIIGKKKGDSIDVDIYKFETNVTGEYVNKLILKLPDEEDVILPGNMFQSKNH